MTGRSITSGLVLISLALSCKTATTRPYFPPVTGAPQVEIQLGVRAATQALAQLLRGDSLPLVRVEPRDGYVESAWFDAATKQPTGARRLGNDVVRVRAWVDPTRSGSSRLTVETIYRPLADPSVDQRALDRQVPPDHPIGARIKELLEALVRLYAEPESATPLSLRS